MYLKLLTTPTPTPPLPPQGTPVPSYSRWGLFALFCFCFCFSQDKLCGALAAPELTLETRLTQRFACLCLRSARIKGVPPRLAALFIFNHLFIVWDAGKVTHPMVHVEVRRLLIKASSPTKSQVTTLSSKYLYPLGNLAVLRQASRSSG